MNLIIVTDIWGKSDALLNLANDLSNNIDRIQIIDPYQGQHVKFEDENHAYQHFHKWVGLDSYSQHIENTLLTQDSAFTLVGFSMGASASWLLSPKLKELKCKQFIGFYGSQIRYLTEIRPSISSRLIFPFKEKHFDVNELLQKLSSTKNLNLEITPYLHGFMNKKSLNFSPMGYKSTIKAISEQLE